MVIKRRELFDVTLFVKRKDYVNYPRSSWNRWWDRIIANRMCLVKSVYVQKSHPRYADVNAVEIHHHSKFTTITLCADDDDDVPMLDFSFSTVPDIEDVKHDVPIGMVLTLSEFLQLRKFLLTRV